MASAKASISEDTLNIKNNIVKHLVLVFSGLCLMVAAFFAATADLPYAENPLIMRVGMGYIGLPFSIALVAYNVYKIATRRSAILIDGRGITDHSNAMASGFIAWDDIQEVYLLRLKSDDYLCVVPADLDGWLSGLSKKQRRLAQANMDAGFAPIRIQFKSVTDTVTSKEGVAFVKKIQPKKVTRVRKPKY